MNKALEGVFAPVVTTFYQKTGELDVASFAANVRTHIAAGLHGVVVTGSTGEAALLDADERAALVDAAREMVPRDRLLIVGTGAESTRTCLRQTKDAAKRGADAVLVVAPHYYGAAMTDAALRQHYRAVADESPVPVALYNIPKYMHFALSAALVAELAAHPNVIGIKDSSGNKELFASYMQSQSDSFAVLTGNAPMFHHAMTTGSRGGILAVSLFAPQVCLDVYDGVKRGDASVAEAAAPHVASLGARIVGDMGVPGVKAAMDRVGGGLCGGSPRAPLMPISAEQSAVIDGLLRSELVAAD